MNTNPNQTASSIRHEEEQARVMRGVLAHHPATQAQAIAEHYVRYATMAKQVLDLLEYQRRFNVHENYPAVSMLIGMIKVGHKADLGITLEWPEPEG